MKLDSFNLNDFYCRRSSLNFCNDCIPSNIRIQDVCFAGENSKNTIDFKIRTLLLGLISKKGNGNLVQKIALNKKRKTGFSSHWNYSKEADFPFHFI